MNVSYSFPGSVQEAVALLQGHGPQGYIIAGGTDLMPLMARQEIRPTALIDVTRIPTLQRLEIEGEQLTIGAAVTYSRLLAFPALGERLPFLAEAIHRIGGTQVRNVATLVGNIANASPAGDSLAALYVLGAVVHVEGPQGVRAVPIASFILGVRRTALQPAELVTHVTLDMPGPTWHGAFEKLALRRALAVSLASVAVLVQIEDGAVAEARIALGAVAPTVVRAQEAEAFLAHRVLDNGTIAKAALLASQATSPIDDVRASAQYRRQAVRGLVRRALASMCNETSEEG